MKKILFTVMAATATVSAAMAWHPKNVLTHKLPKEARHLIQAHYPQQAVTRLTTDWDENSTLYMAELNNGVLLAFDGYGRWSQIDAHNEALPKGIVPRKIHRYIRKNFPGTEIVAVGQSVLDNSYGIILSNDLELVFDGEGNPTGR